MCMEVSQGAGEDCPCGSYVGTIRCEECNPDILQCPSCTVKAHKHQPFHRIEVWDQGRFVATELAALGHMFYLGHGEDRCPFMPRVERAGGYTDARRSGEEASSDTDTDATKTPGPQTPPDSRATSVAASSTTASPDDVVSGPESFASGSDTDACSSPIPPQSVTPTIGDGHRIQIAHINGFHQIVVGYCGCASAPDKFTQLLRTRIIAGSHVQPETGYTCAVLDYFHKLTRESGITAYDFNKMLCRMTDNDFPHKVKVSTHL